MRHGNQFIITLILLCIISCSKDDSNDITAPTTLTLKWEQTNLSSGKIWALEVSSNGNLYASVFDDGFYRSADKGNTWIKVVDDKFAKNIGMLMAQNFSLINNKTFDNLICASASGTYKYGNFGWLQIHNQWSNALCSNPDGVLFSFGPVQNSIGESSVRISSDNGNTWITKFLVGGINSVDIVGWNTVFAAGTAMHRSSDLGDTWVQVISEIPAMINIIRVSPEGIIFTGTDGAGVYYSMFDGAKWFEGNEGLTNLKVTDLVIGPSGYIYIGTEGKGVFKAKYK